MRYRRLHYRYAVVLPTRDGGRTVDPWAVGRSHVALARTGWRPLADVHETADWVGVTVELPGVDPDDVEVVLFEDAVVVEGVRRSTSVDPDAVYHVAEIRQGRFRLELALPAPIDPERPEARFDRGLLQMSFPKARGGGHGR